MGYDGTLSGTPGGSITFTPGQKAQGEYALAAFTAPFSGVYRFQLYASGGTSGETLAALSGVKGAVHAAPGAPGGYTNGYLRLSKGETVYLGAGGTCCAAFVAKRSGALADVKDALLFVAGGGGAGAAVIDKGTDPGWGIAVCAGGAGGGERGANAAKPQGGTGGAQSAPGSAGTGEHITSPGGAGYGTDGGAAGSTAVSAYAGYAGRGGDGYFGGGGGLASVGRRLQADGSYLYRAEAYGGGGGSGYAKPPFKMTVMGRTYQSSITAGNGASSGERGRIRITFEAKGLLGVVFDGVALARLFFNGQEVSGLVYNGQRIFVEYGRRLAACLKSAAERSAFRAATRASFPSASSAWR